MRIRYPKSFLGLLFVGLTLVALPLVVALINNAVAIDRLTNQGQRAVYEATQLIQVTRALSESLTGMERVARQFLVLRDRTMLEAYAKLRERFVIATRQVSTLRLGDVQRGRMDEILSREQRIFEALSVLSEGMRDPSQMTHAGELGANRTIVEEFDALTKSAQRMVIYSNELIDREVGTLRLMSERAYELMLLQMLALIPVAAFLMVGFPLLIVRPIRQLADGIRTLGDGRFDTEIVVDGPADLQNLGHQLNWLRLRLMEVEEQKKKFLSHVSHELKTPLTALREGSDLLADEVVGKLNPEQREIARILKENSIQLRRLIEDLLVYSAVQIQKAKLDIKQVKMSDIVRNVAEDQKLAMRAKGLRLDVECDAVYVAGDEEKLRLVIDNLLSNAIKFSPPRGIIRLALHRDSEQAVIDVIDCGPGIAAEDRDKVFAPFVQGRAAQSGPVKGTGLGLSIVQEHVQAHGGTVQIVADDRPGAHFRVSLPLNQRERA